MSSTPLDEALADSSVVDFVPPGASSVAILGPAPAILEAMARSRSRCAVRTIELSPGDPGDRGPEAEVVIVGGDALLRAADPVALLATLRSALAPSGALLRTSSCAPARLIPARGSCGCSSWCSMSGPTPRWSLSAPGGLCRAPPTYISSWEPWSQTRRRRWARNRRASAGAPQQHSRAPRTQGKHSGDCRVRSERHGFVRSRLCRATRTMVRSGSASAVARCRQRQLRHRALPVQRGDASSTDTAEPV